MLITHIQLNRKAQNKENLFGIMTVHTKNYGRFMFNTIENYEAKIKEGQYIVSWSWSPRFGKHKLEICLLYTSPSPRDKRQSRMPSSA